ncbi:MAG: hypothetical protein IKL10_03190 [Clostridia bacterium]|nr:hypothetical protein [Clostridia bacterium]
MKKFISIALSLLLLTLAFASCSEMGNEGTTNSTDTEETTQNLSVSGTENVSENMNNSANEQGSSDTFSFG